MLWGMDGMLLWGVVCLNRARTVFTQHLLCIKGYLVGAVFIGNYI